MFSPYLQTPVNKSLILNRLQYTYYRPSTTTTYYLLPTISPSLPPYFNELIFSVLL